jgi:hypothetical protein
MKYRQITPEDLRKINPDRKWWQVWKSKYVPKEFEIEVVSGSIVRD